MEECSEKQPEYQKSWALQSATAFWWCDLQQISWPLWAFVSSLVKLAVVKFDALNKPGVTLFFKLDAEQNPTLPGSEFKSAKAALRTCGETLTWDDWPGVVILG